MNIKLILYGIAVAVILGLGLYAKHIYNESRRVPALVETINVMQRQQQAANKASEGYQDEISKLRSKRPTRVVRVCSNVSSPTPDTGRPQDTSAPTGQLPQGTGQHLEQGPDIGADLYGLADRADELAAQLRALQSLSK